MTRLLVAGAGGCQLLPLFLLLLLPGRAAAQPTKGTVDVTAVGTCPTRDAVLAALAPVMGRASVRVGAASPRVADLGERFEVSAAGQRGQYVDAARDCAERARIAAVFIALALNPPVFEARPPPVVTPPPPPPPPPPVAPPVVVATRPTTPPEASSTKEPSTDDPSGADASATWAGIGAGARVDGTSTGSEPASRAMAAGAELRGAVGRRWLGIFAAAGVLVPTTTHFDAVLVRQQRFPFSLGVTARVGAPGAFQLAGDLGVALALFTLRGQGLASASSETRLDVGGRLALGVRFPSLGGGRIVAFTDVHAEFYPRPYHLDVDPLGAIGSTSRLWLGASVGAWFEGL